MVSWSSSKGAWGALGIALAIGVLIAWTQRSVGPSRQELARALSSSAVVVSPADIRSLSCEEQTAGFACHWQQREKGMWLDRAGGLEASARGWRVADAPSGVQ
jgi:hypothetical protein